MPAGVVHSPPEAEGCDADHNDDAVSPGTATDAAAADRYDADGGGSAAVARLGHELDSERSGGAGSGGLGAAGAGEAAAAGDRREHEEDDGIQAEDGEDYRGEGQPDLFAGEGLPEREGGAVGESEDDRAGVPADERAGGVIAVVVSCECG